MSYYTVPHPIWSPTQRTDLVTTTVVPHAQTIVYFSCTASHAFLEPFRYDHLHAYRCWAIVVCTHVRMLTTCGTVLKLPEHECSSRHATFNLLYTSEPATPRTVPRANETLSCRCRESGDIDVVSDMWPLQVRTVAYLTIHFWGEQQPVYWCTFETSTVLQRHTHVTDIHQCLVVKGSVRALFYAFGLRNHQAWGDRSPSCRLGLNDLNGKDSWS